MYSYKRYVRAQSLEEAYTLCQKKRNVVLGGMLWLKMSKGVYDTAIDLCDLGLDQIGEDEESYSIGAMVSLRSLEKHEGINQMTQGAMAHAVEHIVGVQFRNLATLGGSLWGRFGFSDVLTLFMALDAKVELYHAGIMSLADFAKLPRQRRDILVRVILPKKAMKVVYLSQRNTETDFPVLTCAIADQGQGPVCVIGARPAMATVAAGDEAGILKDGITAEAAACYGDYVAGRLTFDSNVRGSAAYRAKICSVLVKRGLLALAEEK